MRKYAFLILAFIPLYGHAWPLDFFDGSEQLSTTTQIIYCPNTPGECEKTYSPHFENSRYQRAAQGIWTVPKYESVDPSTTPMPDESVVTKISWYYRLDPQNCPVHQNMEEAPEFFETVGEFGVAEGRPGIYYGEDGCEYRYESEMLIGGDGSGSIQKAVGTGNFNPGGESEKYFISLLSVKPERIEDAPGEVFHPPAYMKSPGNYPIVSVDWNAALGLDPDYRQVNAASGVFAPLESGTCSEGDTYYQYYGSPYCIDTDSVSIGYPPGADDQDYQDTMFIGSLSQFGALQSNLTSSLSSSQGSEAVGNVGGGGSPVTNEVDTQNEYSRYYNITYVVASPGFEGGTGEDPSDPSDPTDPTDPSNPPGDGDSGSGGVPGDMPSPSGAPASWYESQYPGGASEIMGQFMDDVKQGEFISILDPFKSLPDSGSEPSWTFNLNINEYMQFGEHELSLDSYVWTFLRFCVLFTAVLTCRGLIFGG